MLGQRSGRSRLAGGAPGSLQRGNTSAVAARVPWLTSECSRDYGPTITPAWQAVLTDALTLRDRRDAQAITDQGLAVAHGRLLARLSRLIDTAPALPAAQRFAAHLDGEFPAVLAFLWAPDVDATNWRAEHAIRPAVVNRKISVAGIARPAARGPPDDKFRSN